MAVMTSPQRAAAHGDVNAELSVARDPCAVTKADIRAAIDAVDQWVSDNATSYNTALPVAARNNLTSSQKARLLAIVLRHRFINGT